MIATIKNLTRNTERKVTVQKIDDAEEMAIAEMTNEGDKAEVFALGGSKVFTIERRLGADHWNHPNFVFNNYNKGSL